MKQWILLIKKVSFTYFLLLLLLIIFPDFIFFLINRQFYNAILSIVVTYGLFFLPIFFLRNKLRLYAWILIPFIFLAPVNLACIVYYNVPINDSLVLLAINTNQREALELLHGFLIPILLIILFYSISYYLLITKLPRQISFENSRMISLYSLIFIITLPTFDGNQSTYFERLKARFYTVYPTSLVYALGEVYHQYSMIHGSTSKRAAFTYNAIQFPEIHKKQIYILILGESVRFDHLGINQYFRKTTPKLAKEENLISFTNFYTNAFITEYSVPLIITGVPTDKFEQHYKQKSIVGAFNEAGFKTYWISNQIDNGHIKIHAEEANEKYFEMSDFKATKKVHQDLELLGVLKKALDEPGDKKFIVFHGLGSHYDYSTRYPDSFDYFKPSNKTVFSQATDYRKKDIIINSYDNSILYTDNLLDSIITLTKLQNAVSAVYYISDHGENLFDDDRHLSQHGYPVPSKYIAHVPFFIWYSDSLQKMMPNKIETLKRNKDKKASSENIFYTYTTMCQFDFKGKNKAKSLCLPQFSEAPRQILGGGGILYNSELLK